MSKIKKTLIVLVVLFITLVITGLRIGTLYSNLTMPSFKLQLNDGNFIENKSVLGFRTSFIFITYLNSYSYSMLRELILIKSDSDKIIIINKDLNNNIKTSKKENIYLVQADSWDQLKSEFKIPNSEENMILVYNSNAELEQSFNLRGIAKRKILQYFKKYDENNKGNIKDLCSNIESALKKSQNGYYYFTDNLFSSCTCFDIFLDIENICFKRDDKLNLYLIGKWKQADIDNVLKERNYRVNIKKADSEIQKIFSNWNSEIRIPYFNFIVVKLDENISVFPILDNTDYKNWTNYKKKSNLQ